MVKKEFNMILIGVVFIYFNINTCNFELLPEFIGFAFMIFALGRLEYLEDGNRCFSKSKKIAMFLFGFASIKLISNYGLNKGMFYFSIGASRVFFTEKYYFLDFILNNINIVLETMFFYNMLKGVCLYLISGEETDVSEKLIYAMRLILVIGILEVLIGLSRFNIIQFGWLEGFYPIAVISMPFILIESLYKVKIYYLD